MAAPTVILPAEAAAFVAAGGRDVDTAKLAEAAALAAGAVVPLVDPRGDELGVAIHDPDNQRLRVMVTPADGFPTVSGAVLGWRVERALTWRKQLGLPGEDATYRVLNGAGDGVPGFTCDVLGRYAVLYAYAPALVPWARQLAEAVRGFVGVRGVVVKVRARGGASDVTQEIVGETPPERYWAAEHGVGVEIHPLGGLNVGLFTDMREERQRLGRFVGGGAVANLFSYTAMLSLTCARAGAASVVSVDTSDGVAAWARGNFARAGFAPDDARWRFETGDAVRYLARAAKAKERYRLIVIDPPTFSTARGAPWVLDRDYPALIAQAAAVLEPGGVLWLAANTHELGSLTRLVGKGLKAAGKDGAIVAQGGLPADYPTVAAQPRDRYLQIVVVRVA
ncbi:MAG: class I SAM-dependent rRNA methyltransferase [Myxococcales bacterium]|nr:class I SAM-dependent rRNA methyltransferase [Myxococcales bacterium]